jgi:predicted Zn finger-like uncharacterized protein
MKITCLSCQSKYNVGDKKVQGKIVRIRCRKCAATIVVNGSTGEVSMAAVGTGPALDEPGVSVRGVAPTPGGTWHVNVGNGEPRTMTLGDLVAAYNAGQVTQDMLVWSEGMEQWKPLAEAEAVVAALRGGTVASSPAAQVTERATDGVLGAEKAQGEPSFDPGSAGDATRVAAGPMQGEVQAAIPAAEAKRAAVGKRETRGRDLFSTYAGEELQASAETAANMVGAAHDDGRLTGQRNENSLLFSLAVLTKDADERAPAAEGPVKEDSGVIDLMALVAKSESMGPATRPAAVDVFISPLGFASPTMGGPGAPTAEGPSKSKVPVLVAAIAGIAILLVLGIVIGVKIAGAGSVTAPSASAVGSVEPPPSATVTEPSATAAPIASDSAPPVGSAAPKAKPAHPTGGIAKPAGGGNAAAHAAPNALPPSPAPKKGGDCACNGDLMCMMKCSTH